MSKGTRQQFYNSKGWKTVRRSVWIKQHCVCAICGRSVYVDGINDYIPKENRLRGIVHHIEHLNNNNLGDANITLNDDNLVGVCIDCHNLIHKEDNLPVRDGLTFDDEGNLVQRGRGIQT